MHGDAYVGAMARGRVSVGQGTPGCLELCSQILVSSEPLATLGSGKLCTGIVLCTPFFVFTHVDGVATKEGMAG